MALHSNKIAAEKDAFFSELFSSLPRKSRIIDGDLAARARRLHERFLAIHILSHYRPKIADRLRTDYFELIVSHSIECESLLALGLVNPGMIMLRSALESSLKMLYYECHPVEWQLHQAGSHRLHGIEYREFLYSYPGVGQLPFHAKVVLEKLWIELCKFAHSDLRAISQVSVVSDIKTVLGHSEKQFGAVLDRIKEVTKVIIACCLAVDRDWLVGVEKAYFDAVLDIYTVGERTVVKERLRVA